jgi:predicted dehydrogenase
MDKLRVGILGGGGILGAHAPAFNQLTDRCQVVAVAEPDEGKADRIHELLTDEVRIDEDYRDTIAADDVDAVDIILPHFLHMPATITAAEAGKSVLVEKVMARNVHECDRMIEACDRAEVSLTVCHDRRYDAEWMALKEVVDSGALGEIFYWKLDHNQNVVFPEGSWVRTRDGLGGGAIMSCLTHQIDALRWYDGEVDSVTCMTRVVPERMEGETMGLIGAEMESGALAQLAINWYTRSNAVPNGLWYEMVQVCGRKGEAYYQSGEGTFVLLHEPSDINATWSYDDEGEESGFVRVDSGEWRGHTRCIAEWVKLVRGEEANIVTDGREGRGTVEVAEAAYRAEARGQKVSLPIDPVPWPEATDR